MVKLLLERIAWSEAYPHIKCRPPTSICSWNTESDSLFVHATRYRTLYYMPTLGYEQALLRDISQAVALTLPADSCVTMPYKAPIAHITGTSYPRVPMWLKKTALRERNVTAGGDESFDRCHVRGFYRPS